MKDIIFGFLTAEEQEELNNLKRRMIDSDAETSQEEIDEMDRQWERLTRVSNERYERFCKIDDAGDYKAFERDHDLQNALNGGDDEEEVKREILTDRLTLKIFDKALKVGAMTKKEYEALIHVHKLHRAKRQSLIEEIYDNLHHLSQTEINAFNYTVEKLTEIDEWKIKATDYDLFLFNCVLEILAEKSEVLSRGEKFGPLDDEKEAMLAFAHTLGKV